MLDKVKLALRMTTSAFDSELNDLIDAAYADLGVAGVSTVTATDKLIIRAVVTYVKMNFGENDTKVYEQLKKSYDEQKAQLSMDNAHTTF